MLDRLGQADRVGGAAAALALVSTFMPWYRFDTGTLRVTQNAFGSGFLGDVVFFCAAGSILLVLISQGVVTLRNGLPVDETRARLGLGLVALVAVVAQMLVGINGSGAFHGMTLGLVVAFLATAGMAMGGWLHRQESDIRPARGRR